MDTATSAKPAVPTAKTTAKPSVPSAKVGVKPAVPSSAKKATAKPAAKVICGEHLQVDQCI